MKLIDDLMGIVDLTMHLFYYYHDNSVFFLFMQKESKSPRMIWIKIHRKPDIFSDENVRRILPMVGKCINVEKPTFFRNLHKIAV